LEAAGGHVTRLDGHRLLYNCRAGVINGDFLAFSHPGRSSIAFIRTPGRSACAATL
jgi:3'-phosphoadenosine 5'-phosphosulfate (PAPS) 3'-phosphatase